MNPKRKANIRSWMALYDSHGVTPSGAIIHELLEDNDRLEEKVKERDEQIKRMFDCCEGRTCVGAEHCKSPDKPEEKEKRMGWCSKHKKPVGYNDKPWTNEPEGWDPKNIEKYKNNSFVCCGSCRDYRHDKPEEITEEDAEKVLVDTDGNYVDYDPDADGPELDEKVLKFDEEKYNLLKWSIEAQKYIDIFYRYRFQTLVDKKIKETVKQIQKNGHLPEGDFEIEWKPKVPVKIETICPACHETQIDYDPSDPCPECGLRALLPTGAKEPPEPDDKEEDKKKPRNPDPNIFVSDEDD